jgi:hypothetical protein
VHPFLVVVDSKQSVMETAQIGDFRSRAGRSEIHLPL